MTRSASLFLAFAGSAIALGGCVVRTVVPVGPPPPEPPPVYVPPPSGVVVVEDGPVVVSNAPPPPRYEYIPAAPGPGYFWVRGYWNWDGLRWGWVPGYWEYQVPGHIYVEPTYVMVGGRWEFRRGYWRDPHGRRDYVRPFQRRVIREDFHRPAPPPPGPIP